jgi:hypothetical protein
MIYHDPFSEAGSGEQILVTVGKKLELIEREQGLFSCRKLHPYGARSVQGVLVYQSTLELCSDIPSFRSTEQDLPMEYYHTVLIPGSKLGRSLEKHQGPPLVTSSFVEILNVNRFQAAMQRPAPGMLFFQTLHWPNAIAGLSTCAREERKGASRHAPVSKAVIGYLPHTNHSSSRCAARDTLG